MMIPQVMILPWAAWRQKMAVCGRRRIAAAQKNPDNTELNTKINNYTTISQAWAAESGSEVLSSDTPDTSAWYHIFRSAAHGCGRPLLQCQNDESGPICREEDAVYNPDPSARAAHAHIDMRNFIVVGGWPLKKPCIICGRPYTHYQEQMTSERVAGHPRKNRMFFTVYYETAEVSQR
jgi:hypothetical protein